MMIEKVETFFGWESNRAKTTDFVLFRFKPLFSQPASTNPTKLAENVYAGVLQHPFNFQTKILTGKFYS